MRNFLLLTFCFLGIGSVWAQNFSPSDLPDLALWLSADTGVSLSGNAVTQWNDLSGNNYHATQSNITKAPTFTTSVPELNHHPAIRFDGVNDIVAGPTIAGLGTSSFTFFVVAKGFNTASTSGSDFLTVGGISDGCWIYQGGPAPNRYLGVRSSGANVTAPSLLLPTTGFPNSVLTVVKQFGVDYVFYKNGTLYPSTNANPSVTNGAFIDTVYSIGDGYAAFYKGEIAEMLLYKSALTNAQREQVENYIYSKYAPPVSLGPDITPAYSLCPVQLDAGERFVRYLWSTGDTTRQISVKSGGQYWVRATDVFGRLSYDTIQINLPQLNTPNKVFRCLGQTLHIAPTLTTYAGYDFLWQDGSTDTAFDATATGNYYVRITDSTGCWVLTDSVSLTVDTFSSSVSLGPDKGLCVGNSIHLISPSVGWDSLSFQWNTGSADSLLPVNSAGTYSLTVTNANGCVASDTIQISIAGVAPVVQFSIGSMCQREIFSPINTSHSADTSNIASYLWLFGNGDSSTAVTPFYSYSAPGTYPVSLTVYTSANCSATETQAVSVKPNPTAFYQAPDLCRGVPFTFTDRSTPPSGATLNSWNWNFGDGGTSTQQNPTHTFGAAGSYLVGLSVTATNGCTASDTSLVQVSSSLTPPDAPVLVSPLANRTLTNHGVSFLWHKTVGAISYALYISTDSSFATITHSTARLSDTSAVVSLPLYGNYFWKVIAYNTCNDSTSSPVRQFLLFSPADLPDLALWLSADTGVSQSGGAVAQWDDLSGNNYHATQSNVTKAPTLTAAVPELNSYPALRFDGVNDVVTGPVITGLGTSSFTFFVVAKGLNTASTSGSDFLTVGGISDGCWIYQGGPAPNRYLGVRSSGANVTAPSLLLPTTGFPNSLLSVIKQFGVGYTFYKNGITYPSTSTDPITANGVFIDTIYSIGDGYSAFYKGEIAEMLLYKSALTDTQRQQVENYIYQKYAPPVSLGPDITQTYSLCPVTLNAGNRFVKYLWSTGDTTAQVQAKTKGQYWVQATDVFDRVSSDTIQVNFPYLGMNSGDTTLCYPNSLSLAVAMDNSPYSFQWSSGDTSAGIIINAPGSYSCLISDTGGCSLTDQLTVSIDSFRLVSLLPDDTALCTGNEVRLDTSAYAITSALWSHGVSALSATFAATGQYSVIATDNHFCANYDTISIYVKGQAPTTDFDFSISCLGDTTQFTDLSHSTNPDQISSWLWLFGDGDSSFAPNPTHYYSAPGIYPVNLSIVTDSGCTGLFSKTVTAYAPPIAAFTVPNIICSGAPVALADNSSFLFGDSIADWTWTFDGTDSSTTPNTFYTFPAQGTYQIKLAVVSKSGCMDSVSQKIDVFPPLVADFGVEGICLGDSTAFDDQTGSHSIVSWQWDFGDLSFFSMQQNPKHKYSSAGTYPVTLRVENAIGCVSNLEKMVKIVAPPTASFSNWSSCLGEAYLPLDNSVAYNDTINSWQWIIGQTDYTGQTPTHLFADTGTYPVQLSVHTVNGCTDSVSNMVKVSPLPTAMFYFAPMYGEAPVSVHFTNQSKDAVSYLWNFGDSEFSADAAPTHTFTQNGDFYVLLSAYSAEGCEDTLGRLFHVTPTTLDLAVVEVAATQIQQSDGSYLVGTKATVANLGTRMITHIKFYINTGSGGVISEEWNGILYSGQVMDTLFGAQFVVSPEKANTYVCVRAVSVNHGEEEQNTDNNIQCSSITQTLQVIGPSPNPITNNSYLGLILPKAGTVTISIIDLSGHYVVKDEQMDLPKGRSNYLLPRGKMSTAEYLIKVRYNDDTFVRRFIVGK